MFDEVPLLDLPMEAPAAPAPAPLSPSARPDSSVPRRALYLRWRPRRFADVVGQEHVTRTLRNAVVLRRLGHAYLFTGPRGTGKTSVARILFRAVNCEETTDGDPCNHCPRCTAALEGRSMDLTEIDAASNRGIDDIREVRETVAYRPSEGRYRVYIIDEAHELTASAWDAFLKTLEEPPEHVLFVLATTEAHKVPATIVSRCQRFDFHRIPLDATRQQLAHVADAEGLVVEPEVLDRLAQISRGGLRDALGLLDQLSAYAGNSITMDIARAALGLPPAEAVALLLEGLAERRPERVLTCWLDVEEGGADARQLAEELVRSLRLLLVIRSGAEGSLRAEVGEQELTWLREQARAWTVGGLIRLTRELSTSLARTRDAQQFQVQVELALLAACDYVDEPALAPPPRTAAPTFASPAAAAPPAPRRAPPVAPPPSTPAAGDSAAPTPAEAEPVGRDGSTRSEPSEAAVASRAEPADESPPPPLHARQATSVPAADLAGRIDEQGASLELILERWPDVADRVRERKKFLFLGNARPVKLEGDVLTVAFETDSMCKRADSGPYREVIVAVLSEVLGRSYRLRCKKVGATETEDETSLFDDPVISYAVRKFGGRPRRLTESERETSS